MSNSDEGSDQTRSDEAFEYCAHCGAKLPNEKWCPALTERVDGELAVRSFCNETCRDTWTGDDHSGTTR